MGAIAARLIAGWGTVAIFYTLGAAWLANLNSPLVAFGLFAWVLAVVMWSAFGVVHEAEELAHILGEPYGTLVLTLSIVIIEVALVSAVMLSAGAAPTLGRDTMFAVLMIVLNGVVGIGLLLGGLIHREQSYNFAGASAYLSVLVPLATIALILPNFTTSTTGGTLTPFQAIAFSACTVILYGVFLALQTGRHRAFFISDTEGKPVADEPEDAAEVAAHGSALMHTVLLLASILPIVLLSKKLAIILDYGIAQTGAPPALGGVLIAAIVFTPEGISALRAKVRNELQRALNLCLGAATSTLGLTVPAVLIIGLVSGQTVILGLTPAEMTLLATTLVLSMLTFSGLRTTMLEGAVHLVMFVVYLVLIFSP